MKRSLWLLALVIIGCGKAPETHAEEEHAHEEGGQVQLSTEAKKLAGVETAEARLQDVQESLNVPGTVNSTTKGRAVVTPPAAGRVVSLSVQLGDSVRQGQALAVIESPELAQAWSSIADAQRARDAAGADLKQAHAEVGLAQAKLAAAKTNLARQQELAKAGAFSQAPLQQAQSDLNEAQSELLSIQKEQASHAELVRRLENLYRDGIVSKSELEAAKLELQQDQIRLDRAKAKIDIAKATYERERNISSRGLLNAKELQSAEAEVRAGQLELDRVRIRARSAESALANSSRAVGNAQAVYRSNGGGSVGRAVLTAPISGTVTHLDVTRGQAVERTQTLLEVENLQSVWVTANVPEPDAAKARKGAAVRVTVASLPGREFQGVVQIVGSRIDPKTRSIPVQCLISGAQGVLKPDMFATVRLGIGTSRKALVVPKSAILTEDRKSFLFVEAQEGFEKREVVLGTEDGDLVVVKDGLKAGERVAAKGAFVLASEQKKDELKGHED